MCHFGFISQYLPHYLPNQFISTAFIKPFISVLLTFQPKPYFFPSGRSNEDKDAAEQLLDLLMAVSSKPSFGKQPVSLCARSIFLPLFGGRSGDGPKICRDSAIRCHGSVGRYQKSSFLQLLTHPFVTKNVLAFI